MAKNCFLIFNMREPRMAKNCFLIFNMREPRMAKNCLARNSIVGNIASCFFHYFKIKLYKLWVLNLYKEFFLRKWSKVVIFQEEK
jgi:hypothetical protein